MLLVIEICSCLFKVNGKIGRELRYNYDDLDESENYRESCVDEEVVRN